MTERRSRPSTSSSRPQPAGRSGAERAPGSLALEVMDATFAICRLRSGAPLPEWLDEPTSFTCVTRTRDELSVVCEEERVPESVRCERGWRAIRVVGPLDFSAIGVLASLAQPLAEAGVSLFGISTFDTDYLLVRSTHLQRAIRALEGAGHRFDDAAREASAELMASAQRGERPVPTDAVAPPAVAPAAGSAATATATDAAIDADADSDAASSEGERRDGKRDDGARASRRRRRGGRRRGGRRTASDGSADASGSDEARPVPADRPAASPSQSPSQSPSPTLSPRRPEPVAEERFPRDPEAPRRLGDPLPPTVPRRDPELPVRPAAAAPEPPPRDLAAYEEDEDAPPIPADELEPADPEIEEAAYGDATGAIPQHAVETTDKSFADLGLSPPILATVRSIGFEHPTPIQAAVIPHALAGTDVVGLAETGSGKTAAFALPLAERLTHGRGTRGLILCPTREIALQTKAFLDIFGRDHELETTAIIGGVPFPPQIDALRRQVDIIVATPGRIADHLRRRNARLDKLEYLVLDEADHMLDLGFLPQIREIVDQVPAERQTMLFSATMPPIIASLARRFTRDAVQIDFRPEGQVAAGIEHRLYLVAERDEKGKALERLLEEIPGSTLVFTRRKIEAEWLARRLEESGHPVERIHSDRTQAHRTRALQRFRQGEHRILVATDVAARGIDIPRIEHVVNFELPNQVEDYVHRAGRTARGSAVGIVSSIATWQDKPIIREIEDLLDEKLPRHTLPGVAHYVERKKPTGVRRRRLL